MPYYKKAYFEIQYHAGHTKLYHTTHHTILIPYHRIPCHTRPHTTPYHGTIPDHTTKYHTIPHHTIYHTIQYHTVPYHTIPFHTTPHHTSSHHTVAETPSYKFPAYLDREGCRSRGSRTGLARALRRPGFGPPRQSCRYQTAPSSGPRCSNTCPQTTEYPPTADCYICRRHTKIGRFRI